MNMKPKFIEYFMKFAELTSTLSYAKRLKVGAVIVKDGTQVIATGYNGMPTGWENECEYKFWQEEQTDDSYAICTEEGEHWMQAYKLVTKPETLHSEMNALMKVAQSTESSTGAVMFCTHAPCMDCAKAIYQAGISTLYYREEYRSDDGLIFLRRSGVDVHQYSNGA